MLNGDSVNENELLIDKDHCYTRYSPHVKTYQDRNKLITACLICIIFAVVEVVGGYFADSLAVLTDAAHLLTDFGSFGISLISLYMSTRPATKKYTFGWYRAEILGALISILLIWLLTGVLIYYAVQRVLTPEYDINATIMLITATFGVIVNVLMGLTLHPPNHKCSSGHAHHPSPGRDPPPHDHEDGDDGHVTIKGPAHRTTPGGVRVRTESTNLLAPLLSSSVRTIISPAPDPLSDSSSSNSIAIRAAYIHVLGDLVQSIGILIASFLIYYQPDWKIADPICTFMFSVLVLGTTIPILKDILLIIMEAMPSDIKFADFKGALTSIPGVTSVHDIRVWCLTMEKKVATFHLCISPRVPYRDVIKCANHVVRERFGICHVTIQVEQGEEESSSPVS